MRQYKTIKDKGLPNMLTTRQVLEILNISRATLYRYMEQGKIRVYKYGRDLRFKESDIKAFIEAHEKK